MAVPATWHDLTSARAQWRDAPQDDETLQTILDVAQQQVEAFAPPLPDYAVPANYRLGQLTQARNIWNAGKVDPSNGQIGDDTFVVRPFPLDWTVRQMLRPKRAIPGVG